MVGYSRRRYAVAADAMNSRMFEAMLFGAHVAWQPLYGRFLFTRYDFEGW